MSRSLRGQRLLALPIAIVFTFSLLVATTTAMVVTADHASAGLSKKHHSKKAKKKRRKHIRHAMRIAKRQKGDRYRYGADGPNRFDCSGLVRYSFKKAGFKMPRTSQQQYNRVRHIKARNLRRGDMIFFGGKRSIYHVGIFVGWKDGKRRIVHAPRPGERVKVEKVWTHGHAGTMRWRR